MATADTGALNAASGPAPAEGEGQRSASKVLADGASPTARVVVVPPIKPLEEQLRDAGLTVVPACGPLSAYGADLLNNSPLLQDMTAQEADILGEAMLLVRAEPGQVLIREGEAGDWMLLLLKGTVDVTKRIAPIQTPRSEDAPDTAKNATTDASKNASPASAETSSRVAVIKRGAAVGEMSMLDNEPRYESCTAIEAVEAGALSRHAIALLIRDHPGVGAKVLVKITQLMAQRLRNTSNQLVKLLSKK
jgi:CRP/FNR family cyclic AMP-dependent transcriptional regulator